VLLATLLACQTANAPIKVVKEVDLDRYVGRWYEIASIPQRFQRGCVATTTNYTLLDNGRIRVENECRDGAFDADLRRAEGVAWVTDPSSSQAKLKVQFFWPFRGDYWIIELDPEYRYAVVGHPSRDYLWILARARKMDPADYETLLARIEAQGYDLERLNRTDKDEFYQLLTYRGDVNLEKKPAEWERFYNYDRPHGAHRGKTPYEALREKLQ
jgi:apolipoprotein D and lipocalin family protein